jgi:hypothetical protein
MNKLWIKFLAIFRLSNKAICEASADMGMSDYHDYHDSIDGEPYHFFELTCKRCGKKFTL